MTIEEKAKAYDEARKKIAIRFGSNVADEIFSQFEMSEDERIRKELIDAIRGLWDNDALPMPLSVKRKDEWIAWLEKQGEQKPADKVEPKFKVGDIIRLKDGDGLEWTVEEVLNNGYYTIVCADRDDFIQLDDKWELVEQNPTWSEEDESNILFLTSIIEECFKDKEKITLCSDTVCAHFTKENVIDRLKSLRPQNRWKPSDEQMNGIYCAIKTLQHQLNVGDKRLNSLYDDLKKLRKE